MLCARCMSGPGERALNLVLRGVTEQLPAGARVLDIEASRHTRAWFGRFNQFDYRTLSSTSADTDFRGEATAVPIPKHMCQLIVFSRGTGPALNLPAVAQAAHRLVAADGTVVVAGASPSPGPSANEIRRAFTDGGFAVTVNVLSQRLPSELARRFGLTGSDPILVCMPRTSP
jgi:hypothetical protein